MPATATEVVLDGLAFPEGPRWHDGRLVFSNVLAGEVVAVAADGTGAEVLCRLDGLPSGLGWDPAGRLLVASVLDRRLLRLEPDGSLSTVADLTPLTRWTINDMVVDDGGRAYVGDVGFEMGRDAPSPGQLLVVDTAADDPAPRIVDGDVMFPNGGILTPDGRTLIVGETFAGRLTAWDVAGDGGLSGRRVWAGLPPGVMPDGSCLDAEGCVWVASPLTSECLRVRQGGEVVDRVATDQGAYACVLGGEDRRTLLVCTSKGLDPAEATGPRSGRIEAVRVDVPGAGRP